MEIFTTSTPDTAQQTRSNDEYIEVFNNRTRLYSALGYRTPHEIATECQQKQSLAA